MQNTKLARMIELARGHTKPDVLFSCGEFTAAEIIEYWPEVEIAASHPYITTGLWQ